MEGNSVALRLDDVGASSKKFEIYGHTRIKVGTFSVPFPGNFLFFKYLKPFRTWGPYEELSAGEWEKILDYCGENKLKLTIGITAGWVEFGGSVIPFPEKYPLQASILRKGIRSGIIEIANHGLTHCVVENFAFRPKWFSGNRKWHREFWDWVPIEIQEKHVAESQKILETYFSEKIVTFIPPGNVFTDVTLIIAKRYGLRYLTCSGINHASSDYLVSIPESRVIAFHDKELVEEGASWLKKAQARIKHFKSAFIKEIGCELEKKVAA